MEGSAATGARHAEGSRRIFDVCFPNATKSSLVGVFPISEVWDDFLLHHVTHRRVPLRPVISRSRSPEVHSWVYFLLHHVTHRRVPLRPVISRSRSPEVAGGHTFFIQQLQSPTARWPLAVHATYQFGDQPDYPFGKRQRFRDWGMWLVDDPRELVESSNYLVLEDDVPLACACACLDPMSSGLLTRRRRRAECNSQVTVVVARSVTVV